MNDPYLTLVQLAAEGKMTSEVAVAIEKYVAWKNEHINDLNKLCTWYEDRLLTYDMFPWQDRAELRTTGWEEK